MAALNFPADPVNAQVFNAPNGVSYQYSSTLTAWIPQGAGVPIVIVSPTPPTAVAQGQLWWHSELGQLYISYNDGNSTQWVPATLYVTDMSVVPPGADPGCKSVVTNATPLTTNASVHTIIASTGLIGLAGQKWEIKVAGTCNSNPPAWSYTNIHNGAAQIANCGGYVSVNGGAATHVMDIIQTLTGPTTFNLQGYANVAGTTWNSGGTLTATRLT